MIEQLQHEFERVLSEVADGPILPRSRWARFAAI